METATTLIPNPYRVDQANNVIFDPLWKDSCSSNAYPLLFLYARRSHKKTENGCNSRPDFLIF